jgi:hypothetical protein
VATVLGLKRQVDRNGKVGMTHVISAGEFLKKWQEGRA